MKDSNLKSGPVFGRSSAPSVTIRLHGNVESSTEASYSFDTASDTLNLVIECPDEWLRRIKITCDKHNDYDFSYYTRGTITFSHPGHGRCSEIVVDLYFQAMTCAEHSVKPYVPKRSDAAEAGCQVEPGYRQAIEICDSPGQDVYIGTITAIPVEGWHFVRWVLSGNNSSYHRCADRYAETTAVYYHYDGTTSWNLPCAIEAKAEFGKDGQLLVNDYMYRGTTAQAHKSEKMIPGVGQIVLVDDPTSVEADTETVEFSAEALGDEYVFISWHKTTTQPGVSVRALSYNTPGVWLDWDHTYVTYAKYTNPIQLRFVYSGKEEDFPTDENVFVAGFGLVTACDVLVEYPGYELGSVDPRCVLELNYDSSHEGTYDGYVRKKSGDLYSRSYWWAGYRQRVYPARTYYTVRPTIDASTTALARKARRATFVGKSIAPGDVELFEVSIQVRRSVDPNDFIEIQKDAISGREFSFSARMTTGQSETSNGIVEDHPTFTAETYDVEDHYATQTACKYHHRIVFRFRAQTRNTGMLLFGRNDSLLYGSSGGLLYSGIIEPPCG